MAEVSFDEYLLPIQEELGRYERFRRLRVKEELKLKEIIENNNPNSNLSSTTSNKPSSLSL